MFHHVRQCTVKGFGSIALLENLWSNYIIPLGYYTESVKHALIALGSSHCAFITSYPDDHQVAESQAHNHMAMRQYAKAAYYAKQDLENLSPATLRTSLVCCLVFVCFEIMQGRYDKAIRHLQAGSRLLVSLSEAAASSNTETAMRTASQRCLAETVNKYFDQLCDISDMFNCLGCDTAYLVEDAEVIPDLSFFLRPASDSDATQPFSGVSEARYDLHRVEKAFGAVLGFSFRGDSPVSWTSFLNLPADMSPVQDDWIEEWAEARRLFDTWSTRLDLYIADLRSNARAERNELRETQLRVFIKKDWELLIRCSDPSSSGPPDRSRFEELLGEAESLVQLEDEGNSLRPPLFTLAADLIPRMVFIAALCGELDLQQRAIALLYSMRRKEGLWDSREIAIILQSILAARESSIWNEDYERVFLPRLAGMLTSLHLHEGGVPLPLATLVDLSAMEQP